METSLLTRSASSRWQKVFTLLLTGLGVCGMLLLSACGSSGGGSNSSTSNLSNTGMAMVTLTDLPGDFLSYVVSVDSLQLTRSDGTVVQTVSNSTQVDFAQLVDLSEIISAQQVPAGNYVSVTLTLDYSAAKIVVDNGTPSGLTVSASNILNSSTGMPFTAPVTMTLTLPSGTPLVITPGTVANLALDFNLAATNTVAPATITASTAASAVTVTVTPTLSASLMPDTTRQIRVRGPLVSVDPSAGTYTINVRPFFDATGTQGQFVVTTTPTTTFTINGTAYTSNSTGLPALQALGAGTPTMAYGSFDVASGTFTASNVLAGTNDSVEGTVTAVSVSGGTTTLTVDHGMVCHANQSGVSFSRSVTVTVGPGTAVTEQGQSGSFSAQDVSVGQHLQVFGTYGTGSGAPTLNASAGSAFLMFTQVWGLVTANTGAVFTLNLQSLDGQPPSAFNFAGTGTSSATDATASAYTVGVPAALQTPSLTSGPAGFRGFVTPFGMADGTTPPDFSALTLVNYTNTNAQLVGFWTPPGVTAPFASLSATSTSLVMTPSTLMSAQRDVIRIGPESIDPATLGVTLQPNPAATMPQFVIAHRGSWKVESFSSFADLVTALATDLNGTTALLGLFAEGPYDATSGVLSVNQLLIALSD
jgi:Domain of unknown function (DUF4382)